MMLGNSFPKASSASDPIGEMLAQFALG